jgi:glyoxylase-like metal-dependent hydrolase (beta-lactamase superfamily II)
VKTKLRICLAAALLASAPSFAQQDFSGVEIQTIPVRDGLYMLLGSGGNIALSTGSDGAFIVDTQYAALSDKIMAAVRAAGGGDVRFVVNTHFHGDHTGGNENFGNAGATIMAQDNVQVRLSTAQVSTLDGSTTPPAPKAAIPVVTFPERMTFHWNGTAVNLYYAPNAHTDGDSIVHYTDLNAFHMGDTFFNGGFPFIDVGAGGSLAGYIAAAESVLARSNSDTLIIPGHGALATPDDLRAFLDMLRTVNGRIRSMIEGGMTEDEVVAANPTSEYNAQWGGGFMNAETFTRFAYQGMKR